MFATRASCRNIFRLN